MTHVPRFDPATLSSAANETFSVRRVFGEAYELDGVTVIPVARLWAATGVGYGELIDRLLTLALQRPTGLR